MESCNFFSDTYFLLALAHSHKSDQDKPQCLQELLSYCPSHTDISQTDGNQAISSLLGLVTFVSECGYKSFCIPAINRAQKLLEALKTKIFCQNNTYKFELPCSENVTFILVTLLCDFSVAGVRSNEIIDELLKWFDSVVSKLIDVTEKNSLIKRFFVTPKKEEMFESSNRQECSAKPQSHPKLIFNSIGVTASTLQVKLTNSVDPDTECQHEVNIGLDFNSLHETLPNLNYQTRRGSLDNTFLKEVETPPKNSDLWKLDYKHVLEIVRIISRLLDNEQLEKFQAVGTMHEDSKYQKYHKVGYSLVHEVILFNTLLLLRDVYLFATQASHRWEHLAPVVDDLVLNVLRSGLTDIPRQHSLQQETQKMQQQSVDEQPPILVTCPSNDRLLEGQPQPRVNAKNRRWPSLQQLRSSLSEHDSLDGSTTLPSVRLLSRSLSMFKKGLHNANRKIGEENGQLIAKAESLDNSNNRGLLEDNLESIEAIRKSLDANRINSTRRHHFQVANNSHALRNVRIRHHNHLKKTMEPSTPLSPVYFVPPDRLGKDTWPVPLHFDVDELLQTSEQTSVKSVNGDYRGLSTDSVVSLVNPSAFDLTLLSSSLCLQLMIIARSEIGDAGNLRTEIKKQLMEPRTLTYILQGRLVVIALIRGLADLAVRFPSLAGDMNDCIRTVLFESPITKRLTRENEEHKKPESLAARFKAVLSLLNMPASARDAKLDVTQSTTAASRSANNSNTLQVNGGSPYRHSTSPHEIKIRLPNDKTATVGSTMRTLPPYTPYQKTSRSVLASQTWHIISHTAIEAIVVCLEQQLSSETKIEEQEEIIRKFFSSLSFALFRHEARATQNNIPPHSSTLSPDSTSINDDEERERQRYNDAVQACVIRTMGVVAVRIGTRFRGAAIKETLDIFSQSFLRRHHANSSDVEALICGQLANLYVCLASGPDNILGPRDDSRNVILSHFENALTHDPPKQQSLKQKSAKSMMTTKDYKDIERKSGKKPSIEPTAHYGRANMAEDPEIIRDVTRAVYESLDFIIANLSDDEALIRLSDWLVRLILLLFSRGDRIRSSVHMGPASVALQSSANDQLLASLLDKLAAAMSKLTEGLLAYSYFNEDDFKKPNDLLTPTYSGGDAEGKKQTRIQSYTNVVRVFPNFLHRCMLALWEAGDCPYDSLRRICVKAPLLSSDAYLAVKTDTIKPSDLASVKEKLLKVLSGTPTSSSNSGGSSVCGESHAGSLVGTQVGSSSTHHHHTPAATYEEHVTYLSGVWMTKDEVNYAMNGIQANHEVNLLALYRLESFRAQDSLADDLISPIFRVLEQNTGSLSGLAPTTTGSPKPPYQQLVVQVCNRVFVDMCLSLRQRGPCQSRQKQLEKTAQVMLLKANSFDESVSKAAICYLKVFTYKFPQITSSSVVISTMFDLIRALTPWQETDFPGVTPEVPIPGTDFTIRLRELGKDRKQLMSNFISRCHTILRVGLEQYPDSLRAVVAQYWLDLASECGGEGLTGTNASDNAVLRTLMSEAKMDFDMSDLLLRVGYNAGLAGSVSASKTSRLSMAAKLRDDLENCTPREKSETLVLGGKTSLSQTCHDKTLAVCAFLVSSNRLNTSLLELLCRHSIQHWNSACMTSCVKCFEWLIAARPELQLDVLSEISRAWQLTQSNGIGIFATENPLPDPLAVAEDSDLDAVLPDFTPHAILLRFLCEKSELVRLSFKSPVWIFVSLLSRTLNLTRSASPLVQPSAYNRHAVAWTSSVLTPGSLGTSTPRLHRSLHAMVCRCRLALMALDILHSQALPRSCAKTVLRERLYAAMIDFFSLPPSCHKVAADEKYLKELIQLLIKVYQGFQLESRFLVVNELIFTDNLTDEDLFMKYKRAAARCSSGGKRDKSVVNNHVHSVRGQNKMPKSNSSVSGFQLPAKAATSASVSGRAPAAVEILKQSFVQEFTWRKQLVLSLLTSEIERLCVWFNPLQTSQPNTPLVPVDIFPKITEVNFKFFSNTLHDATPESSTAPFLLRLVEVAWRFFPDVAVHLADRYPVTIVQKTVENYVLANPELVSHIPAAVRFIITTKSIEARHPSLTHLLTWTTRVSPPLAISLFSPRRQPNDPITHQFGMRALQNYPPSVIVHYIPQLVQALRHDSMNFMRHFLAKLALKSQLTAHQLIWNIDTNEFKDEAGEVPDKQLQGPASQLRDDINAQLTGAALHFYLKQFKFFKEITDVSAKIKPYDKQDRKQKVLEELRKVKFRPGCYLPSNPGALVVGIVYKSASPMQSAAKAPYRAAFNVKQLGFEEVERICLEIAEKELAKIEIGDPAPHVKATDQMAIFKVGDDVRQDIIALQIITMCLRVNRFCGLDLLLEAYRVVATGPGCGVIECVPNVRSIDEIVKTSSTKTLYQYYSSLPGTQGTATPAFQEMRYNFLRSMAAYSVLCYLLQVKDRHNANIMLSTNGKLVHIDFGFLFESSPGGNIGFEPHFKLTDQMIEMMGGMQSAHYSQFKRRLVQGFIALRPYEADVVNLVTLLLDSGLPCFRGKTITLLRDRFKNDVTQIGQAHAAVHMQVIEYDSAYNKRTGLYDVTQKWQNKIEY